MSGSSPETEAATPVVVLGSANVDLIVQVRDLPRRGETVKGGDVTRAPGGKGANQAVGLARLGRPVRLVGRVGDDDHGRWLRGVLDAEGVDTSLVVSTPDVMTGTAMIALATTSTSRQNMIVVSPGANGRVTPEDLAEPAVAEAIRRAPAVVAQLELPHATVAALVDVMGPKGEGLLVLDPAPAPTSFDPLPRALLERADVLVPNRVELARITERIEPSRFADLVNVTRRLRDMGFAGDAVVTLGEDGALVLTRDDEVRPIGPRRLMVVDPTGAGDAFCAALTDRMLRGEDVVTATEFAVIAGALATCQLGAQSSLPDTAFVESLRDLTLPAG